MVDLPLPGTQHLLRRLVAGGHPLADGAVEGPRLAVSLGELVFGPLVLDDDELPVLRVRSGGRLEGNLDASLQNIHRYRPRHIEALVKGRLIRWLRAIARTGDGGLRFGARRVVGALAGLAGARMVGDLADFFVLVRAPLERMLVRVESARKWLQHADTSVLLVTSPRDTGAVGAVQLASALRDEGLAPRAVIVNRTWPPELAPELASVTIPPGADAFVAYARAELQAQAAVVAAVETWAPAVVVLPSRSVLIEARRPALVELGLSLSRALAPAIPDLRSAS